MQSLRPLVAAVPSRRCLLGCATAVDCRARYLHRSSFGSSFISASGSSASFDLHVGPSSSSRTISRSSRNYASSSSHAYSTHAVDKQDEGDSDSDLFGESSLVGSRSGNQATDSEGAGKAEENPTRGETNHRTNDPKRPLTKYEALDRPRLPGSIKRLNRILSRTRIVEIPESDLDEKFVKGRGPGGQAINKTNSSVSLTHIPTGIRVQAQPTRSREENRKAARKILAERLEVLRATGQLDAALAMSKGFSHPSSASAGAAIPYTVATTSASASAPRHCAVAAPYSPYYKNGSIWPGEDSAGSSSTQSQGLLGAERLSGSIQGELDIGEDGRVLVPSRSTEGSYEMHDHNNEDEKVSGKGKKKSKGKTKKAVQKEEEKSLSTAYTKAEIRAEKERRRKANRAKKAKRKYGKKGEAESEADGEGESEGGIEAGSEAGSGGRDKSPA